MKNSFKKGFLLLKTTETIPSGLSSLSMLQIEVCWIKQAENLSEGLFSLLGAVAPTPGMGVGYLILPPVSLLPLRFRWSQNGKLVTSNKTQSFISPARTSLLPFSHRQSKNDSKNY